MYFVSIIVPKKQNINNFSVNQYILTCIAPLYLCFHTWIKFLAEDNTRGENWNIFKISKTAFQLNEESENIADIDERVLTWLKSLNGYNQLESYKFEMLLHMREDDVSPKYSSSSQIFQTQKCRHGANFLITYTWCIKFSNVFHNSIETNQHSSELCIVIICNIPRSSFIFR